MYGYDCFDVDDNDNDDSDGDVDDDRKEEGSDGKAWLIPPRSIPQISHSCLPSSTIILMMTIYIYRTGIVDYQLVIMYVPLFIER